MDRTTLAKRLKNIREGMGISQNKMSERCDLSPSHYTLIEQGKRSPEFDTLKKLADGIGITMSELLREDGEPDVPLFDKYTNAILALMAGMSLEEKKYCLQFIQIFANSRK